MKALKKIFLVLLTFAICFYSLGISSIYARDIRNNDIGDIAGNAVNISDYLTEDDIDFMLNLQKIYSYFQFDEQGRLILSKDVSELKNMFNFDDNFIDKLNKVLESDIAKNGELYAKGITCDVVIENCEEANNTIKPMVHVSDWKVYFTYDETMTFFLAAAQVGAPAIIAALASLGTAIGGPVGGTIGMVAGYLSGADFLYLVLRASVLKKGIYIGIDWDGPFPVASQGTW